MGRWADRGRGIGHPLPTASEGLQAGRWRRAHHRLDSTTYRLQNRRNKARMSMKTKDKYKKSGSADRRFCGLRLFHDRWGEPRTANTAIRATLKSGEQSENVYENKGRGQEVDNPLTRLATLATLPDFWGPMDPIGVQKSDSPGRGLLTRFIREPQRNVRNTKIEGTKRECL
jgi:hypothetical protein